MLRDLCIIAASAAAILTSATLPAVSQAYPSRPIEMVVTWGPGGGADQTGRMIGKLLEPRLGVSLPVDNVAGAAGVTGLNKILGGAGDGYQIGIMTADTLGLLADPKPQRWGLKDISPIAVLIVQKSGLFVKADGDLKSWKDVEARAKEKELKVAVTGLGTPDDVAVEQLRKRGLKLLSVPFAKPAERYVAVIGGHADLLYEQAGDIRSFIEGKQLSPVLFLSDEAVAQFPSVATTKSIGMSLVLDQFRIVMSKAGIPADHMSLLAAKVADAAKTPEYKAFLEKQWADPKSVVVGPGALTYIENQIKALKALR